LQADSEFCRRGQRREEDGGACARMPETSAIPDILNICDLEPIAGAPLLTD